MLCCTLGPFIVLNYLLSHLVNVSSNDPGCSLSTSHSEYTVFDLISGLFAYVILGQKIALISEPPPFFIFFYFVCVYPGCKMLLPKIVACEGALIMMTGTLKKKNNKKKKKKGCLLIRACSRIRSNTVCQVVSYLHSTKLCQLPCTFSTFSLLNVPYLSSFSRVDDLDWQIQLCFLI